MHRPLDRQPIAAALPPGAYVVQVRYVGEENRDQQLVHLTVAQP